MMEKILEMNNGDGCITMWIILNDTELYIFKLYILKLWTDPRWRVEDPITSSLNSDRLELESL